MTKPVMLTTQSHANRGPSGFLGVWWSVGPELVSSQAMG
jgi:hypothetical protein